MGKKSVKENKSIYQTIREELNLTREQAAELLDVISENKLVKIENGTTPPRAEDILIMAKQYKRPDLCNYYCSNECPIGQKHVPSIKLNNLAQITMGLLASFNSIQSYQNRLIEITADGLISEDEYDDFQSIQKILNAMSVSISEIKLWVDNAEAKKNI